MGLRVVAAVALDECGLRAGRPGQPRKGGKVSTSGSSGSRRAGSPLSGRDNRNPVGVGENMMFRPGLAAIGRVRSSFFPA